MKKDSKPINSPKSNVLELKLLFNIRTIWERARSYAVRTVDTTHVKANWLIRHQIIEAQQSGKKRVAFGEQLLQILAENLSNEYGTGFSVSSLRYMRLFYQVYPDLLQIHHPMGDELTKQEKHHSPRDKSALLDN